MVIQEGLRQAQALGCWCRPVLQEGHAYRYEGKQDRIWIRSRDKRNAVRADYLSALTRELLESDWQLCDEDGHDLTEGMKISELLR